MTDAQAYAVAMLRGDIDACARIEQRHDMYGYPPELVSVGLGAIEEGKDAHAAIEDYLTGDEV